MKAATTPCHSPTMRNRQSGLALMVALIALVAMTLAGVALVRSIDTNAMIAGNLAFRQSATLSADAGTEEARTWLLNNESMLENNQTSSGYYATKMNTGNVDGKGIDITGSRTSSTADNVKWKDADGTVLDGEYDPKCLTSLDSADNQVCYIIQRMCANPGALDSPGVDCSTVSSERTGDGSKGTIIGGMTYQPPVACKPGDPSCGVKHGFYRITVRVSGPRNNSSYIQSFVQR